jgi:hypothetical protein
MLVGPDTFPGPTTYPGSERWHIALDETVGPLSIEGRHIAISAEVQVVSGAAAVGGDAALTPAVRAAGPFPGPDTYPGPDLFPS